RIVGGGLLAHQPAGGAHHIPAGRRGRLRGRKGLRLRPVPAVPVARRDPGRRPDRAARVRPAPAGRRPAPGRAGGMVPDGGRGGRQQRPYRRARGLFTVAGLLVLARPTRSSQRRPHKDGARTARSFLGGGGLLGLAVATKVTPVLVLPAV